MAYPPPPPPSVPYSGPPPRPRGRPALIVGTLLLAAGIVLLVLAVTIGFRNSLGKVDGFQRVSVAQGRATLMFEPGSYVAYYEAQSLTNGANVSLSITDVATGDHLHIGRYGNSLTYSYHGHHGRAVFAFTISRAGQYDVEVSSPTPGLAAGSNLAFGPSIAHAIVTGVLLLIGGVVLLLAGLITLIVGLVIRHRSKKRLAAPGWPGGYPPQGPPPGYPPRP